MMTTYKRLSYKEIKAKVIGYCIAKKKNITLEELTNNLHITLADAIKVKRELRRAGLMRDVRGTNNPTKSQSPKKIYMVSFPENADYAEWWYIVGLFSTKEKAETFIKKHKIRLSRFRMMRRPRPATKYFPIVAIELDNAPIVHDAKETHDKSFYGLSDYDLVEYFYKKDRA